MIVLGISNTKDSGACLLKDGTLVAAVNEERLNRDKMTRVFPRKSIDWILESERLKVDDIDAVGLGAWKEISAQQTPSGYASEAMERIRQNPQARKAIESRIQGSIASDTKQWAELKTGLREMGLGRHRILQCSHQIAHAYTAFEYSPYGEALVVCLDGRGDFMSGSVSRWKKGSSPEILRTELEIDSLGAFYGWITHYLGFTPDRHEGKVTGLSAFGNSDKCIKTLKKMIKVEHGSIYGNIGKYYAPYMRADLPELCNELDRYDKKDVAAAAQKLLEESVISYISYYLYQTGEHNLCVAGGVFANVLVNMRLRELPEIEQLFVFPHMGDGGIAAGGAAYAAVSLGDRIKPVQNMYLGPCIDKKYSRKVADSADVGIAEPADFSKAVASLLYNGAVVGFFSGCMEYGPRALGARSILVQATDPGITAKLNRRLNRTEFMPFAPVTLEEEASSCYMGWAREDVASYYMTTCYRCTDLMKRQSPGVIHIDGTARPQIINRGINKEYYDVLKAYQALSGIPSIINTSFNYHEEPIICYPEQAVNLLKQDSIDILAISPLVIYKDTKWQDAINGD